MATAMSDFTEERRLSVETEKGLDFMFRHTQIRTKTVLWSNKMIYNMNYFKRSINPLSEVHI